MTKEFLGSGDNAAIALQTSAASSETVASEGLYRFECRDSDGNVKWVEEFPNQVVQAGKQLMLDTLLRTASGYVLVGPYLGLVATATTYSPTDTMSSHVGWTEFTNYTVGGSPVRGTAVFGAAAGNNSTTPNSNVVTSAASGITYLITGGGGTVTGCFLVTGSGASATISDTGGTLYSAGGFANPKTTTAGDTVVVTYSTTATS